MKTLDQLEVAGQRVLLRVDYNVPLRADCSVSDSRRIEASAPTVKRILSRGGSVILLSHLGRPKGFEPQLSLKALVPKIAEILGAAVTFLGDPLEDLARAEPSALSLGGVSLLENLRFHPGEERGDLAFAQALAELGDRYVNDAFATAHRAHASTAVLPRFFPGKKAAGYSLQREIQAVEKVLKTGEKPITAIVGGAKISSKIATLKNLLPKVDHILIGGGMAYTFLKALGGEVGDSLLEPDKVAVAEEILEEAEQRGLQISLPTDVWAADAFDNGAQRQRFDSRRIQTGWQGLDLGPETLSYFKAIVLSSKTLLWNGPMGVFEFPHFAEGTRGLGTCVAQATQNGAFSLVGGGDSVAAVKQFGLQDRVSLVSTGGGAMLACLEGKPLPAMTALTEGPYNPA